MKFFKRSISVLLSLMIILSTLAVLSATTAFAATASIRYYFANEKAGYAEGKIEVTLNSDDYGDYYLYWADDTKALEGYDAIACLNITSSIKSYQMPAYTAIPADATKLVAVKSSEKPDVNNITEKNAAAVYSIPKTKQLADGTDKMLYSFASIGDPQLAEDHNGHGGQSYKFDDEHLTKALVTLADRKVDFAVSSGDTVNDQNGNQTYMAEYRKYQRILADSPYANPIYEAIGNHELWAEPRKEIGIPAFIKETGLDSTKATINKGKPYYEITEPVTGDHFIFMALEGSFRTCDGEQFSTAQLDWLEGLLKKYSKDGKNIFIIEHGNIKGWGAGDRLTEPYYYDLGLNKNSPDVQRFIKLMETYKECVIITAHTHLELSAQYNYFDNNGTSAVMIHNSAIGGVRRLINGSVNRDYPQGASEGYIVQVYKDCILFNGINLYRNEIMPSCSYIVPFGTSAIKQEEPTTKPTTAPTTQPTTKPTTAPTTQPTTKPTTAPTTQPTTKPTTAPTTQPTTKPTTAPTTQPTTAPPPVPSFIYGDANMDKTVDVKDVTAIQYSVAKIQSLASNDAMLQAEVTGDFRVNISDATMIQLYIAGFITKFPVEEYTTQLAKAVTKTSTASLADTLTLVKNDLEKYYTYSSYDQYMALKKACRNYDGANLTTSEQKKAVADLTAKQEALYEITGGSSGNDDPVIPTNPTGPYTVYFTNDQGWSTVKAYVWGTAGEMSGWPGKEMTYASTNKYGQKIYSISFDYKDYQKIIFTNGSGIQTVDIVLTGDPNIGYYVSGSSGGKLTCKTYTYS